MKVEELIEKLKNYKDFDVEFIFSEEPINGSCFPTIRHFKDLDIGDIGHSDKVILLSGEER